MRARLGSQRGRDKGCAVRVTRALQRKAQIVQYSEQGLTLREAAERSGLSEHGVRSVVMRAFGHKRWPIPGHEPDA